MRLPSLSLSLTESCTIIRRSSGMTDEQATRLGLPSQREARRARARSRRGGGDRLTRAWRVASLVVLSCLSVGAAAPAAHAQRFSLRLSKPRLLEGTGPLELPRRTDGIWSPTALKRASERPLPKQPPLMPPGPRKPGPRLWTPPIFPGQARGPRPPLSVKPPPALGAPGPREGSGRQRVILRKLPRKSTDGAVPRYAIEDAAGTELRTLAQPEISTWLSAEAARKGALHRTRGHIDLEVEGASEAEARHIADTWRTRNPHVEATVRRRRTGSEAHFKALTVFEASEVFAGARGRFAVRVESKRMLVVGIKGEQTGWAQAEIALRAGTTSAGLFKRFLTALQSRLRALVDMVLGSTRTKDELGEILDETIRSAARETGLSISDLDVFIRHGTLDRYIVTIPCDHHDKRAQSKRKRLHLADLHPPGPTDVREAPSLSARIFLCGFAPPTRGIHGERVESLRSPGKVGGRDARACGAGRGVLGPRL
jgi:hypothetical protein